MKKFIIVTVLILVSIILCGCSKEEPRQSELSDPNEKVLYENIITEKQLQERYGARSYYPVVITWEDGSNITGWD